VPSGVQNVAEAGLELVEKNIALEVMGHEGRRFTPFLAALFYWILFMNLFGLVPLVQLPAASRMAIPMFLALLVYVLMWGFGFKAQGPRYLTNSIFPPGVPKFLYVLVTPIELVSKFVVRPFSHAVRLFANLMAGHILLTTFALLTAALWIAKWNVIFLPLPFAMGVAMTGFEVLVAALQAYIFTILAAVYLNESLHPDH
jgi:F-type H+-transporting ATPase subunit a